MVDFNDEGEKLCAALLDEFRATLDDTLILSILGDFDLPAQYDQARELLQSLAADAPDEEASLANSLILDNRTPREVSVPGAFPTDATPTGSSSGGSGSGSRTGSEERQADESSRTDVSDGLLERFEAFEIHDDVDIATLDEDGKISRLHVMFPELNEVDIKYALKRANGDFLQACEELLLTQYLEDEGLRPKGIDGAFQGTDDGPAKPSKKRARPKKQHRHGEAVQLHDRLTPLPNLDGDDTSNNSSKSEAAFTVVSYAAPPKPKHTTPVVGATYTTNNQHTINSSGWQTVPTRPKTCRELSNEAAAARQVSNHSRAAAAEAFRRGKSDTHFRAVAGFLASRASQQATLARAAESLAYDAHVHESSRVNYIDLHGVPVADGVRIAQERTAAWWNGLGGEERTKRAKEEGFVIVTGIGRHSAGGVSQMRQQVPAALKRAGWSVRTETGQFVVTGRA